MIIHFEMIQTFIRERNNYCHGGRTKAMEAREGPILDFIGQGQLPGPDTWRSGEAAKLRS